ncbi:hypothetical protein [Undibacterium sp. RuTC16W]|uniref:hypothetical protein n=1 Tax=Undibacterium sp. RuTC16W TaxID=3413048 RepID=UPI003BF10BFD
MLGSWHYGHLQPHWKTTSTGQRLTSALLAACISIVMLMQLNHRPSFYVTSPTSEIQVSMLMEPPHQQVPQQTEQQTISAQGQANRIRAKKATTSRATSPLSAQSTTEKTHALHVPVNVSDSIADREKNTNKVNPDPMLTTPSTSLLVTDSQAIRKAYKSSQSEIQAMADNTRKEMTTPVVTRYEQFQTEADKAKIQDCIKPRYSQSTNLLLIPVIAFAAVTGKCK